MFGDWNWVKHRERQQGRTLAAWREAAKNPLVIELGAGTDIPSVRSFCERQGRPLIRVNPREPALCSRHGVSLSMGALEAMRGIRAAIAAR